MESAPELTPVQERVLAVVDACMLATTRAAAGHDVRVQLLGAGMGKREIAFTLGELVARGVLERVKIVEQSGLFYTAYRRARKR